MASPAAILNILVKADIGDAVGKLKVVDGQVAKTADKTEKSAGKMGVAMKAGGIAAAAGLGVAVTALKKSADVAKTAQVSQRQLHTTLKTAGVSWKAHGKEIDKVTDKTSKLSGLSRNDLRDSFTTLVRTTGSVQKSLKGQALAADIARAKGISLEQATKAVNKAYGGSATALNRYGVSVKKGATGQDAIAAAQKKYAGQAEAYGKTAAGAQDRFNASIENVQETIGMKLLPVIAAVNNSLATFISGMQDGTGVGGQFAAFVSDLASKVSQQLGPSFAQLGTALKTFVGFMPTVMTVLRAVSPVLIAAFVIPIKIIAVQVGFLTGVLRGLINFVVGVFTLNWRQAWTGVQQIARAAFNALRGIFAAGIAVLVAVVRLAPIRSAANAAFGTMKGAASSAIHAVGSVFSGLKSIITNALSSIPGALSSIGRRIGSALVSGITNAIRSAPGAISGAIKALIPGPLRGLLKKGSGAVAKALGLATGGYISGNPAAGDVVPALLKGGEVVLNEKQQRMVGKGAIFSALRATGAPVVGGGGGVTRMAGGGSVAKTAIGVARKMGASAKETLALIEAGIVESGLRNLSYGDRDSVGFLQQRPSQGWTGLRNVPKAAAEFLRKAMAINSKGMTAGQLAQSVQRSAFPGRYDAVRGRAQAIIEGYGGKATSKSKKSGGSSKGGGTFDSTGSTSGGGSSSRIAAIQKALKNKHHSAAYKKKLNTELASLTGSSAASVDDGSGAADTSAADALNGQLAAISELYGQFVANQNNILRLSNQGPEILASVVAAVSGQIGGASGLGFQSVGIPGSVARL